MKKNPALKGQLHKALVSRRRGIEQQEPSSSRNGLWLIVGGMVLTIGVFVGFAAPSLWYHFNNQVNSPQQLQQPSNTLPPPTPPSVRRALNGSFAPLEFRTASGGVVDSTDHQQSSLVAISVDNMLEGRPASGIDQALWVFEVPAEATITRFLAVFDAQMNVSEIGPVRSARPYMIDLAQSIGAVLVHSGGSPEVLQLLAKRTSNRTSINEFSQTPYFWRDSNRPGPHNLYTSLNRLREHSIVKALKPTLAPLGWLETTASTADQKVLTIGYPEPYTARWAYNPSTHRMERRDAHGNNERTRSGAPIAADTVIIQFTDVTVLDAIGRRSIRTLGEGDAMVVANGAMELARWVRQNPNDRATLVDITGLPLSINPGVVWWTVVSKGTAVSFE